ncbi:MAG: hypothetical protein DWH84_05860 [Planctomycetota bacterium]|nr:MAG: hypothetical protein DWH84_05860 [Planctomycetota bacterium]
MSPVHRAERRVGKEQGRNNFPISRSLFHFGKLLRSRSLVALQILWLNSITDIFPAFALALEPSAPDMMNRPPRAPQESLLTPRFVGLIVWQGLLLAGVTLVAFAIGLDWHGTGSEGLRRATTMAFMTLALTQVFHVFNARSQNRSALTSRLWTNGWLWGAVATCLVLQIAAVTVPLLQRVLHTVVPTASEWGVIAGCSLLPVVVVEFVKLIQRAVTPRGVSGKTLAAGQEKLTGS